MKADVASCIDCIPGRRCEVHRQRRKRIGAAAGAMLRLVTESLEDILMTHRWSRRSDRCGFLAYLRCLDCGAEITWDAKAGKDPEPLVGKIVRCPGKAILTSAVSSETRRSSSSAEAAEEPSTSLATETSSVDPLLGTSRPAEVAEEPGTISRVPCSAGHSSELLCVYCQPDRTFVERTKPRSNR